MLNVSKYANAPDAFVARTLARHTVSESGCWHYAGSTTRDGYAQANYNLNGRQFSVYPHVLAYQLWRGPLVVGYQIDHQCHDPAECTDLHDCLHRRCINPNHLAQVLPWDNGRRSSSPAAVRANQTHCPQGHTYDRVETDGHRRCSICRTEDKRRDYQRNGARANAKRVEKMRADPEYRERRLAASRARSASERVKAARRERYANDPEYREKLKARSAARYRRLKEAE